MRLYSNPSITTILLVCGQLCADEIRQIEVSSGTPYDPQQIAVNHYCLSGPKWFTSDGENDPISVAGYTMIRPGVWRDWMLNTPKAFDKDHWRSTTKYVKRVMDDMLEHHAHRLECVCLADRTEAHRWYSVLGLRKEVTMQRWGAHGEDAVQFSRIRKGPAHG